MCIPSTNTTDRHGTTESGAKRNQANNIKDYL